MQITKKLSVRSVFGDKVEIRKIAELHAPTPVPLVRFYGVANNLRRGETTTGEFIAVRGKMRAINLVTGEEFEGVELFMPDVPQQMLVNALYEAGGKGAVQFGFDIAVIYDKTAVTEYQYTATPLMSPAEDDPLAFIAKSFPELPKLPALAAPKTEEKPAKK